MKINSAFQKFFKTPTQKKKIPPYSHSIIPHFSEKVNTFYAFLAFLTLFSAIFLPIFGSSTSVFAENPPISGNSANNFNFKSFSADYYLEKDQNGISKLHVVETLVAEFPDYNQNHGITRIIPYIFESGLGKHLNVKDSNYQNLNLKISRNNNPEPWFVSEKSLSDFTINIGSTDSYVRGEQTYKIEYDLENVIGEYPDSNFQEFYWDANGNGWHQSFDSITATIHLSNDTTSSWIGDFSCYVGKYGVGGEESTSRCVIEKSESTIKFSAENLLPTETLTFNIGFKEKSFKIPEPEKSYIIIFYFIGELAVIIFLGLLTIKSTKTARENKNFYKSIFEKPEYEAPKDLTIQESAALSIKPLSSENVATLVNFAVNGKIELIKGKKKIFGGNEWRVKIISLEKISDTEKNILDLLNRGKPVRENDIIVIKKQKYNSSASSLAYSIKGKVKNSLKDKKFFSSTNPNRKAIASIAFSILLTVMTPTILIEITGTSSAKLLVGEELLSICFGLPLTFTILNIILYVSILSKYSKYTKSGLKKVKELEGLETFIRMTEKDRLAFFQSVETADVSHQGIVNLYEKLLPYAILFGVEKTWLKELNKYYKFEDVRDTYWYHNGIIFAPTDLRAFSTSTMTSINSVSASSASSTSSSSSSFSGGGGGGFSGGGGGGGGGGGW